MKVFVYGTLKKGYGNNRLLSTSEFVEEAIVPGYKLYHCHPLGGFPVAMPCSESYVRGEIWDIKGSNSVLASLDMLEGEGRMYNRTRVTDDIQMYVGHPEFWSDLNNDQLCSKDSSNIYQWG